MAAEMKAALAWKPGTGHMNFARGELGQQQRQHVAVADYSHRKNTKRTPAEVEQRLLRSRHYGELSLLLGGTSEGPTWLSK